MEIRLKVALVLLMAGFFLAGYASAEDRSEQKLLACGQGWYETLGALDLALQRLEE